MNLQKGSVHFVGPARAHMGPFGSILVVRKLARLMYHFGSLWVHMDPYGSILANRWALLFMVIRKLLPA